LEQFNVKYGSREIIDAKTMETLKKYSWPGNVRELRNQMERKVIQSLQVNNDENFSLAMNAVRLETNQQKSNGSCGTLRDVVKNAERQYINQVLQKAVARSVKHPGGRGSSGRYYIAKSRALPMKTSEYLARDSDQQKVYLWGYTFCWSGTGCTEMGSVSAYGNVVVAGFS